MKITESQNIVTLETTKDCLKVDCLVANIRSENPFRPGDVVKPLCELYKDEPQGVYYVIVRAFEKFQSDRNERGMTISYNLEMLKMCGNRLINHSEFWPHYLFEKAPR